MTKETPKFERLEGFPKVAVVQSLDDFTLWQQRAELDINTIICRYPADMDHLKDVSDRLVRHARSWDSDEFNPLVHDNMTAPNALRAQFTIYEHGWRPPPTQEGKSLPYPKTPAQIQAIDMGLDKIVSDLTHTFIVKAGASQGKSIYSLHARINSDYPRKPHKHDETIAMSLTGDGTVIYADEDCEKGYTLKAGEVALFDDTVMHNGPEYDESWEEEPRANLIIG